MVCAGYVFMDLPKSEANKDLADEGTAAGEYLEHLLLNKPIGEKSSQGIYFNEDIRFFMKCVYDDILTRAKSSIISCEQKIDWQTKSGIWIAGRYDVSYIDERDRLVVEDLKYGWGIVEVKENWQLIGYAIGEVIRRSRGFNEIVLRINQPRPHHEDGTSREWVLSYSELLSYKDKIEARLMEISTGRKDLQTSSECKYCMGAAEACPAFSRLFYRALEVTTEFFQDSLTDKELSDQLDQVKRAEEVIKIKKDSLTELGVSRIKQGRILPNYVQVQTYGNRTWKKGISPEAIKVMTGVDVVETTFLTPAKVEKLGIDKGLVAQLSEKRLSGVKLEKKDSSEIGNKIFGNTNPQGGY